MVGKRIARDLHTKAFDDLSDDLSRLESFRAPMPAKA